MKSQPSEQANTLLEYERHRKEIYIFKNQVVFGMRF